MRILVLQLARFGDIYQTWPTLQALKRNNPKAEIHLLVRERFRAAAPPGVVVHALPTAEILRGVIERGSLIDSHLQLAAFLQTLVAPKFDSIVNLSFSPVSSYITDYLATPDTEVRGYTRHTDGHFTVSEDSSAYFHAQVGIGRANRYHVTEIFAAVAGVDLIPQDFVNPRGVVNGPRHGVVAHLGASSTEKCYSPELWVEALREFQPSAAAPITLIGSASEKNLSDTVIGLLGREHIINLVGATQLNDLFTIIGTASVLIGADSAPVHIAALTNTPVLNLTSAAVNFWETGPMSAGSRALYSEDLQKLSPLAIARETQAMLRGQMPMEACAVRAQLLKPFELFGLTPPDDFSWALVQALYTGSDYPKATEKEDILAFQRLFEMSELALQQLRALATS